MDVTPGGGGYYSTRPSGFLYSYFLGDVLDTLSAASEEVPLGPIEWAQNRLLDEVLEHWSELTYPIVGQSLRQAAS
jgi:hypothetical protein